NTRGAFCQVKSKGYESAAAAKCKANQENAEVLNGEWNWGPRERDIDASAQSYKKTRSNDENDLRWRINDSGPSTYNSSRGDRHSDCSSLCLFSVDDLLQAHVPPCAGSASGAYGRPLGCTQTTRPKPQPRRRLPRPKTTRSSAR